MEVDWELSQQFVSDSQGIRAAAVTLLENNNSSDNDAAAPAGGGAVVNDSFQILTGTQGGGLCAFGVPSASIFPMDYQHNHSVTALLSIPGSGLYATGCKDSKIRLFDSQTHRLQATLEGHEKPVTSLALATATSETGTQPYLLSGSWDGTAKVWDISRRAMMATLPDHENSVCVTGLPAAMGGDGSGPPGTLRVATGSAGMAQGNQVTGHSVRLWTVNVQTGQVQCTHKVANDHDGPIRNICLVGGNGSLATCSNDGSVRLRSTETGESLSALVFLQQQHPPMLLSVISLDNGSSVAASAEDGHVVVWNLDGGGGGEPQILLHPACVWNVVSLPNGDLATCCDDGTLRIFTRASDRMAPLEERERFAATVQEAHKKKSSGPTPEEIAKLPLWEQNGSLPGTSEGQVHVFNKGGIAVAAQWSAVSRTWVEVGQVMGSSDGGTIDGESFDHVLPIEVDQTGGGVAKLQIGYNNGENTFVAAQRFIDKYMLPQHHLAEIADYIQQRVGTETPTLGGSGGAGGAARAAPVATTGVPMVSFQHLPMTGYKSFELPSKSATTTLEKMKTKIQEFGKLSEPQTACLASLMEKLGATSRYHATTIDSAELALLSEMLEFPPSEAFPALDLARMTVLHPDAAAAKNEAVWMRILAQAVTLAAKTEVLEGPAAVAIPMLSLRLFANSFRGGPGSGAAAIGHLEDMLKCAQSFTGSSNKNVRLSVATLLYNIAFYLYSTKSTPRPETAAQIVAMVDTILQARTYEAEALVRSLVALGTAALANPEVKEVAKTLYVVSRVEMAASPHGEPAKTVAKEVYQVLQ